MRPASHVADSARPLGCSQVGGQVAIACAAHALSVYRGFAIVSTTGHGELGGLCHALAVSGQCAGTCPGTCPGTIVSVHRVRTVPGRTKKIPFGMGFIRDHNSVPGQP